MGLKIVGKIELPKERKREKQTNSRRTIIKKAPTINALFDQQKGLCYYCGERCLLIKTGQERTTKSATIEHLIRKDDILSYVCNRDDYIVMACHECNQNKDTFDRDIIYEEYKYKKEYSLTEFINYNKWWKKIIRKMRNILKVCKLL